MIKVDIPEPFIDGDNTMVNITSDSFCYSSIDSRYEGFQSSYKDGNMNQKIQGKLEIIADQFKELIKIIEDGKTFVNTGVCERGKNEGVAQAAERSYQERPYG